MQCGRELTAVWGTAFPAEGRAGVKVGAREGKGGGECDIGT